MYAEKISENKFLKYIDQRLQMAGSISEKKSILSIYDNFFNNEFTMQLNEYENIEEARDLETQISVLESEIRGVTEQAIEVENQINLWRNGQLSKQEFEANLAQIFHEENFHADCEALEIKVKGYEDYVRQLEKNILNL
jgi:hypothetical protein